MKKILFLSIFLFTNIYESKSQRYEIECVRDTWITMLIDQTELQTVSTELLIKNINCDLGCKYWFLVNYAQNIGNTHMSLYETISFYSEGDSNTQRIARVLINRKLENYSLPPEIYEYRNQIRSDRNLSNESRQSLLNLLDILNEIDKDIRKIKRCF